MEQNWDCIVVGGGAAGLSAALVLGRARQRTLVIDAGQQSNLPAHGIGGLLGHDGRPPAELYAMGRGELATYPSVEVRDGTVVGGRREDAGAFVVDLADGSSERADRVLLATGMDYRRPDVPGLAPLWGRSVFHCPFCHGWEVHGQTLGVLDRGDMGVHRALLLKVWSDDITLFTDGPSELDEAQAEQLRAAGVIVDERPVASLQSEDEVLTAVAFTDGSSQACAGLLVPVTLHQRSALAEELGAVLAAPGPLTADAIEIDTMGYTNVAGLSAAGDAASSFPSVANAIAAGSYAAAMLVRAKVETQMAPAPGHEHGHAPADSSDEPVEPHEFWDALYGERDQIWSGNPNAFLVREVEELAPGTALDLGCGEGGDSIWLAQQGWQVTGVDISTVALERAAAAAEGDGVANRIDWRHHDLAESFPDGTFDLVSAQFFHSPVELPRDDILRAAAAAVRPGGTLLIVGHADMPPWARHKPGHGHADMPSPAQVLELLDLDPDEWHEALLESPPREAKGPDGETATLTDSILRIRRRPG